MRKFLFLLFILPILLNAQEWKGYLSEKGNEKQKYTFYEIQAAFERYNVQQNINNGKRNIKGTLLKVPGWKQYKRWEWFWEKRVNRSTGEFYSAQIIEAHNSNANINAKTPTGNWMSMGPSASQGGYAGIGRINGIAFHPTNQNIIWAGAPSGGVWLTEDGGNKWKPITDENEVIGVSDIIVPSDYATTKTLFIATGDRDGGSLHSLGGGTSNDNNSIGVLKSVDTGESWQATGLTFSVSQKQLIGRLVIHPTNNKILLAGTSSGIYKTTDGAETWDKVLTSAYVIDIEFKPGNSLVLYASTMNYWGKAAVYKSTNGGEDWTKVKEFTTLDYRVEMAVTEDAPGYLYLIIANQQGGLSGIYKSTDSGATFSQKVDGSVAGNALLGYFSDGSGSNNGQGDYDLCIVASPNNKNVVYIGGINTWKTTDGGSTWEIVNMWTDHGSYNLTGAPEVHADKHTLVYSPQDVLFEGNDGGIYKSTDNGASWTDISNTMVISQIYRLGVSQLNKNKIITGLQDNGTKYLNSGVWTDVTGGDGLECIIDGTDSKIQYSSYINGVIFKTENQWEDHVEITQNIDDPDGGAWLTPYALDPNNHEVLVVGYTDLWMSDDQGGSFSKISDFGNESEMLKSLDIAPSNSNYIYTATLSKIYRTKDGGDSWNEITGTLPVNTNGITNIKVSYHNAKQLWVTMGGYDNQRIFESTNGGDTWENTSNGLPNLPVMCVEQNKLIAGEPQLYAGTDVGVFVKSGGDDWVTFNQGLPNVVVTELEIYYDETTIENSRIRAATYGRGLWESELYTNPIEPPVAGFIASTTDIMMEESVDFTDQSTNNPTNWSWSFEGGIPSSSTLQNPSVTYPGAGNFDVTLTVQNEGGSHSLTKTDLIHVSAPPPPSAAFTASSNLVYTHQKVYFSDESTNNPETWEWEFEGATPQTSLQQNPVVEYAHEGTYNVSLKVSNQGGSDQLTQLNYIDVALSPDFAVPHNVQASSTLNDVTITWDKPNVDTLFAEGFEDAWPPVGWSVKRSTALFANHINPTSDTWFKADESSFSGGLNPEYIYAGNNAAGINYTAPDFNWLISPTITPKANHKLSFWLWYYSSQSQNYITKFYVMVYSDSTWETIYSLGDGSDNNQYKSLVELSLVDYANKPIQIAFVYEYNDGFQLLVDEVAVASSFTGYKIYRNDKEIATLGNVLRLSYNDLNLANGPYDYYMTALYTNPDAESDTSLHASTYVYGTAKADFTANNIEGPGPLVVEFNNQSVNTDTYFWDFGDGFTSTEESPVHTYKNTGMYRVMLIAENPNNADTLVREDFVNVWYPPVIADFDATNVNGDAPLQVSFTNNSQNAENYFWDFGDGQVSEESDPLHTYNYSGFYNVKLVAYNPNYTDTLVKERLVFVSYKEVVADFSVDNLQGGIPFTVHFINNSINEDSYWWDFGDGSSDTLENPVHTYLSAGDYTVSLIASNPLFADTLVKEELLHVFWPKPLAHFGATPLFGIEPLQVQFVDSSEHASKWYWTFSDGTVSEVQNPLKVFNKGVYTVSLKVTNPAGSDTLKREDFIVVDPNDLPENIQDKIKIYPNPVADVLYVEVKNTQGQPVIMRLIHLDGRVMHTSRWVGKNEVHESIATHKFATGTYILQILHLGQWYHAPVVIE